MALHWSWNEKCGEGTFVQTIQEKEREFTVSFYEGNAFLIMLNEFKDDDGTDVYTMYNFFADKDHAKRCLGLAKNSDGEKWNILSAHGTTWKKIRLNKAKSHNWKQLVTMFAQAFDNITIEIYTENN